jgi:two-component system CheB/CheR fusion protein
LPEILRRITSMQVSEAIDGVGIKPDNVYVIPPNKDISLLHDKLRLFDPTEKRGLRLPIDFFFRTLAEDRKDKSIGVILSGMGSDGMLGQRVIREASGLTLAQAPASASADAMPRSVIEAGLADIVAIPEEMPAQIVAYLKHHATTHDKRPTDGMIQGDLEKIIVLLRNQSGVALEGAFDRRDQLLSRPRGMGVSANGSDPCPLGGTTRRHDVTGVGAGLFQR